jgi:hypothetical protein
LDCKNLRRLVTLVTMVTLNRGPLRSRRRLPCGMDFEPFYVLLALDLFPFVGRRSCDMAFLQMHLSRTSDFNELSRVEREATMGCISGE